MDRKALPAGLVPSPLPDIDPSVPKRETTWVETAVEGWDRQIAKNISEMRDASNGLDFERFMDAFEDYEHNRSMQLAELVREVVEIRRHEKPFPATADAPPTVEQPFRKFVKTNNPAYVPIRVLDTVHQPAAGGLKSSGRKAHALIVVGFLAGIVILFFSFIAPPDEKPTQGATAREKAERKARVDALLQPVQLSPETRMPMERLSQKPTGYSREADEELERWSAQQDAIQASRDAANAASDAAAAMNQANADAARRQQETLDAVRAAREAQEEQQRQYEQQEHFRRFQERSGLR